MTNKNLTAVYIVLGQGQTTSWGQILNPQIGQDQTRVIIYINFVELESPMLHAKFQYHKTTGSGEDFVDLYHIWAWQPSWSCDLGLFIQTSLVHIS